MKNYLKFLTFPVSSIDTATFTPAFFKMDGEVKFTNMFHSSNDTSPVGLTGDKITDIPASAI